MKTSICPDCDCLVNEDNVYGRYNFFRSDGSTISKTIEAMRADKVPKYALCEKCGKKDISTTVCSSPLRPLTSEEKAGEWD